MSYSTWKEYRSKRDDYESRRRKVYNTGQKALDDLNSSDGARAKLIRLRNKVQNEGKWTGADADAFIEAVNRTIEQYDMAIEALSESMDDKENNLVKKEWEVIEKMQAETSDFDENERYYIASEVEGFIVSRFTAIFK